MSSDRATTRPVGAILIAVLVLGVGAVFGYVFLGRQGDGAGLAGSGGNDGLDVRGIACVAVDAKDNLYVGGEFGLKLLSPDHRQVREWQTPSAVKAVAVDEKGNVYAGYATQVEKFDAQGHSLLRWGRGGCDKDEFGLVTGLSASGGDVYVADSGQRIVYRFRDDGTFLNSIGDKEKDSDGLGIVLPSPFLDCAAGDGAVWINNPGRKRVEQHDPEGKLRWFWGKSGWGEDEFPGCCNPTNLALAGPDKIVVADKGIPRVRVFSRQGQFLGVLGGDVFDKECKGIDLAVDSKGMVYAVDNVAGRVRVLRE